MSRIFCVVVVVLVVVVVVVRVVVAAVVVVVVVVVAAAVVVVVATVVVVAVSKSACTCVAEPALNVHVGAVDDADQRTKVEPALASACNWMRA